jgi:hypothetical protein
MHGGEEKCTQGFGGETEGKRPFGSPRYRWEDNMKINLKERGWEGMGWMRLA